MNFIFYFLAFSVLVAETLARSHYHSDKFNLGSDVGPHPMPEPKPVKAGSSGSKQTEPVRPPRPEATRYHQRSKTSSAKAHAQHTGVDWIQTGQDELNAALNSWPKWKPARNVIYFIGDGMGVSTLTAGRIFKAQREGKSVTDAKLSWEEFPYTGVIKTYNTDQQTPDSAGTATAFACGEKSRDGVIGVNENVRRGNCSEVAGNELRSIVHYAQDENKWAGIVTTTRITHATPACAYAHSPDRGWEADKDVPAEDRDTCWDIARQLVHNDDNKILRVVLGGGRREFFNDTVFDNEYPTYEGERRDGRDLRQEWLDVKAGMGLTEADYKYVENKTDFDNVDSNSIQYLLGLFEPYHMKYEADRLEETGNTWTEPSLAEMVKKSLDILKRGPDGYMLYVEGGRIDHAHHGNNAHKALRDVMALQDAVQVAMNETDVEDTLIMVTADHSHVFTMAGYQKLDNDILGVVIDQDDEVVLARDDKPYLTLSYANGPGFEYHRSLDGSIAAEIPRIDITNDTTNGVDYDQDGPVPLNSETHGGEDVVVYARGPMAHLFSGQHEQHYIAHAAMYASCLGWNKDFCTTNPPPPGEC